MASPSPGLGVDHHKRRGFEPHRLRVVETTQPSTDISHASHRPHPKFTLRSPEFHPVLTSSRQATGVFVVPVGVPRPTFGPSLLDTRKPEARFVSGLPAMPREGLEPSTY